MSSKFVPKRPINNIPALVQLTHCGLVDLQKRAILTPYWRHQSAQGLLMVLTFNF